MTPKIAVILAGGVGARIGLDVPKQLIKVAGKSILEHTLAAIHDHDQVDEVVIMMAPGHLDTVHEMVRGGRYPKVTHVLEGADTRNATTQRALDVVPDDALVLLHDAVRPLVSARVLTDCFAALERYDAVDVAIPSADTIIEVSEADPADPGRLPEISAIRPRSALRRGQTPQGFRASVLKQAYALAAADEDAGQWATDDCAVVLRYLPEVPIGVVAGEERNLKITEPIDVYLADKLFQLASRVAPAAGDDEHYRAALAGRTMVVFGGSYGIGADIAALAERCGARVFSFSRSGTHTHVERRGDIEKALGTVLAATDSIDFVVNTAGVLPRGELVETSEETVYNSTEVNYLAPVFISQTFYPALKQSRGSLLLFTSSSYTRGRSGYSLYSSAKAAVVNLTQALADEWSGDGIRVNCINPERTATPMRTNAFGVEPEGTLLESEVVARASLDTLLSADTGHIVDIRRVDPLSSHEAAASFSD
ncbi:MAG TPA: bifunctional cytidylyltransferase/SDR family oxidoreductase [Marmoricola sp.]